MYRPQHRDEIYIAKANEVSPADVVIPADRKLSQAFKPRARLLQLLGDQLIGSSKLAVFELVKIAYDADASKVEVELGDLGTASPWIRVEDNGQGMSLETIRDVWLVPGDDHREKDSRIAGRRSTTAYTGGETLDALANGHPANRLAELMPWSAGA